MFVFLHLRKKGAWYKFQNQYSGTIEDVPQIEALGIPDPVVLLKSIETKVNLKTICTQCIKILPEND